MKKTILFLTMFISIIILSSCSYINFNKTNDIDSSNKFEGYENYYNEDGWEIEYYIKEELTDEQKFYLAFSEYGVDEYLKYINNDIYAVLVDKIRFNDEFYYNSFAYRYNETTRTEEELSDKELIEKIINNSYTEDVIKPNTGFSPIQKNFFFLVTDKYNNAYINKNTYLSKYNDEIKALKNNSIEKETFKKIKYNNSTVYLPKAFTDDDVLISCIKYNESGNVYSENITFEMLKENFLKNFETMRFYGNDKIIFKNSINEYFNKEIF